jgi:hypothetical protein
MRLETDLRGHCVSLVLGDGEVLDNIPQLFRLSARQE